MHASQATFETNDCLIADLHCRTQIWIPTRIRWDFPVGTIVSCRMFTFHSGSQSHMGTLAIFVMYVRTQSWSPSPSLAM